MARLFLFQADGEPEECVFKLVCRRYCENPTHILAQALSSGHMFMKMLLEGSWIYDQDKQGLTLTACNFVRQVWSHLGDWRSRKAVEVAEMWATGQTPLKQLRSARWDAHRARAEILKAPAATLHAASAATWASDVAFRRSYTAIAASNVADYAFSAGTERIQQCRIMFDVLGCPYRFLPTNVQNDLLCAPGVSSLSQEVFRAGINQDGTIAASECLPVLADALEEAGLSDAPLLAHLRSPGPHYQGMWSLRLVTRLLGPA